MATNPDDILGMSDEDIANMSSPPAAEETPAAGSDAAPAGSETNADDEGLSEAEKAAQANDGDDPDAGDGEGGADSGAAGDDDVEAAKADPAPAEPKIEDLDDAAILAQGKPPVAADPAGDKKPEAPAAVAPPAGDKPVDKSEEAPAAATPAAVEVTSEQAAAFYKQVMAPFKANGKTIELKSPEEVISLMQMGANYTRKMQDIQPHRKVLTMLQNNDLLDEGKLSFLIDLDRKDPAAIQKLIKESGIDPLDIDTAADPTYSPGDHQVSDEEMNFRTAMDDLKSNPSGLETIALIHDNWDNASKQELWKEPSIMTAIHDQRESGVYDLITTEMERRRTLGQLPTNLSFLDAYKAVGDAMLAEVAADTVSSEPETPPAGEQTPPVVVTRAAAPKKALANGDRAAAASPTRSSPKAAQVIVNPLAMSDEDFQKLPSI